MGNYLVKAGNNNAMARNNPAIVENNTSMASIKESKKANMNITCVHGGL